MLSLSQTCVARLLILFLSFHSIMATTKTVLITGGNRGLGKSLVDCFLRAGWKVLATARSVESLPQPDVVDGKLQGYRLDLSQPDDINTLVSDLLSSAESIDCIIHNAGYNPKDNKSTPGYFESTFYVKDFSAKNVAESMMINALYPMELTGKLLPAMKDDCLVIAISSWLGSIGQKSVPGHYGYTGSKALMNMCMKGLSLEFAKAPENRVAIALNPGWMQVRQRRANRRSVVCL
jgi:NAD(P)-dependent dehydrogenase (short-subunit alcohol dehydrogenase family)